jgi:hypothetical protein
MGAGKATSGLLAQNPLPGRTSRARFPRSRALGWNANYRARRRHFWWPPPASKPPPVRARWTLELLADEMVRLTDHEELSSETVRRRLAENHLKPWRKDMWCTAITENCDHVELQQKCLWTSKTIRSEHLQSGIMIPSPQST